MFTLSVSNTQVICPLFELKATKPVTVASRFPFPGPCVIVKVNLSVVVQNPFDLHLSNDPWVKLPNTALSSGVLTVWVVPVNVTAIRALVLVPLEVKVPVVVYVTVPATASEGTSNVTAANSNTFLVIVLPPENRL